MSIKIWSLEQGALLLGLDSNLVGVDHVAFSSDGKAAAGSSHSRNISSFKLLEIETGVSLPHEPCYISAKAFTRDGKLVALGLHDNTIQLWNAESLTAIRTLKGHSGLAGLLSFSPDSRTLASISDDETARLRNTVTGHQVRTLDTKQTEPYSVAFSPDGSFWQRMAMALQCSTKWRPALFCSPKTAASSTTGLSPLIES